MSASASVVQPSSTGKSVKAKDDEEIFSMALLPPIYLVVGYIVLLRYMASELKKEEDGDPFKKVWWSGPIFFTFAYLCMIFFGQKYMANREPMKIKPYIFTYNLYQCLLNIWTVAAMAYEVYTNPIFPTMWGNVSVPGAPSFQISLLVWVHYNNKFVELLDTVWMVLRKKNEQVRACHPQSFVSLVCALSTMCF